MKFLDNKLPSKGTEIVYALYSPVINAVKIGHAACMSSRMSQHTTNYGHRLTPVAYVYGTIDIERNMHRGLRKHNGLHLPGREWYTNNKEIGNIVELFAGSEQATVVLQTGQDNGLFVYKQSSERDKSFFTSNSAFCSISSMAYLLKVSEDLIRDYIHQRGVEIRRYALEDNEYYNTGYPDMIRWDDVVKFHEWYTQYLATRRKVGRPKTK